MFSKKIGQIHMDFPFKQNEFQIKNICNWNLETHKTVYPPEKILI